MKPARQPGATSTRLTAEERDYMARRDGPMHTWFELSYSSYLVLPRSLIQEMPVRWQRRMVALIEEMRSEYPGFADGSVPEVSDNYRVRVRDDETKRYVPDPLSDYRHPDHALIERLRKKA
jgi:hypothetical protein